MTVALQPRTGPLAWAWASASGRAEGLAWVDALLRAGGRTFMVEDGPDGPRFRHVPYGLFLPPPMLEAAQAAQEEGAPTALEGLVLAFARPEWWVATRHLWFTPSTPLPRLLTLLVEAYGIDRELHRDEPDTLVTLLAHLPRYYPHRGDPARSLALLEATVPDPPALALDTSERRDELFACHDASWWARRGPSAGPLTLRDGAVRIPAAARPRVRAEDVVFGWSARADRLPHELLRLLPAWASVRLTAERAR